MCPILKVGIIQPNLHAVKVVNQYTRKANFQMNITLDYDSFDVDLLEWQTREKETMVVNFSLHSTALTS